MSVQRYPYSISIYKGEGRILLYPLIRHIGGYSISSDWYYVTKDMNDAIGIGQNILKSIPIIHDSPISKYNSAEIDEHSPLRTNSKYKSWPAFVKNNSSTHISYDEDGQYTISSQGGASKLAGSYEYSSGKTILPPTATAQELGQAVLDSFKVVEEIIEKNKPTAPVSDYPHIFGYKMGWIVVKNSDPAAVMSAFGLKSTGKITWNEGVNHEHNTPIVYVSSCVKGYIFILGLEDLEEQYERVTKASETIGEIQFFCNHRISDYYAYGKFEQGKVKRSYCFCGDEGAVLLNKGRVTKEEKKLGFDAFPKNNEDEDYENTPSEDDIVSLAQEWGKGIMFHGDDTKEALWYTCHKL